MLSSRRLEVKDIASMTPTLSCTDTTCVDRFRHLKRIRSATEKKALNLAALENYDNSQICMHNASLKFSETCACVSNSLLKQFRSKLCSTQRNKVNA